MTHRYRSALLAAMIVCAFSSFLSAQTTPLPFQPIDAQYSKTLDRIVMISAAPNQVHSYDPVTNTDTTINLPRAPLSMSIDPDGIHVAVGHDGLVSYVNLLNQTVDRVYQVPLTVNSIALNGSYAYLFTLQGPSSAKWMNLTNGATGDFSYNGFGSPTGTAVSPLNKVLYATGGSNVSFDISNGVPSGSTQSSVSLQGRPVLSSDNTRLYNGCPDVYAVPPSASQPLSYLSTLPVVSIQAISDSAASSKIAIIPSASIYCSGQPSPTADTQIALVDRNSYTANGTMQIAPFTSGNKIYSGHGKYVFFNNAGNRLFAISQADSTATGLSSTFEIQSFDLSTPPVCAPVLNATSASVSGAGGVNSVAVTAPADCAYQVSSSAPWLQITSGPYSAGNGSVQYLVRPNTGASSRSADITIGNQKLTVTQDAGAANPGRFTQLSFTVAAADYSKGLDRLVILAAIPNELHIYDPVTSADQIVSLPRKGRSLSVSPDGMHAAVGFAGLIAYVNLQTAMIEKTFTTTQSADTLALNANGLLYYSGMNGVNGGLRDLDITSGTDTLSQINVGSSALRLHPSGMLLYSAGNSVGSFNALRLFLSGSTVVGTNVGVNACGNLWLAEDGSRYYSNCGKVYSSSVVDELEGTYLGTIPGLPKTAASYAQNVQWAVNSAALGSTAYIPVVNNGPPATDSVVNIFGDASFNSSGQVTVPSLTIGSSTYTNHGRYVFWSKNSDRLIVLAQADSAAGSIPPWTVGVISPANNDAGCSVSLSPTSDTSSGSFGEISVTSGANCAWTAQSSASWLTLSAGAFGVGNGSVDYVASVNPSTSPRTATITVGGQTFTFTQSGATGTVTLSPTSASVPASGGSGTINVTASSPSYSWSATSDSPWLTITSGFSGTGSSQVKFAAAPTSQFTSRTGTITVSGQTFQVTQAGATLTITYDGKSFSASGSQISINYTVDSASASPRVISGTPWINVSNNTQPGSNTGTIYLSAYATDLLSPRSGSVTIGNQTIQVTQDGGAVSLFVTSANVPSNGGKSSFSLNVTSSNLKLTPVSSASWLKVDTSCCLPNSVSYSTDPNPGATPRIGTITVGGQAFTVIQAGIASSGLRFVPITPCRIADTRNPAGAFGGPNLGAFATRDFPIASSSCNLPASALAYSLNITVAPLGPLGYLTAYPAGQSRPEVSTLNSYDGRVVANAAIVPAGDAGAISIYATDPTNVIIDINGYFDATNTQGLAFFALQPCRAVDTRAAASALGGPGLSFASRDFPLATSPCQVPASTQAYSLNVTAVPSGVLNYLTVWPTGQNQPGVSTLNSYDGSVVANAAIAPAGSNGSVSAYASGATNVLLDINGVFAPAGSVFGAISLKFYPLAPCRVADTRGAAGPLGAPLLAANAVRSFPVSGTCGIPANAQAYALNVTVVPKTSSMHFLSLWPSGQTRPEVSTLNSYQGKVLANAAIVPAGVNGAVSAFATEDTELILDVNGYFAP